MKNIILAGSSLNSDNKGVNALTNGQIRFILDKYGQNCNITIIAYALKEKVVNNFLYNNKNIKIVEIPASKKQLIEAYVKSKFFGENNILKLIKEADLVLDISEGDSFSDIYGVKRFIQHSLIKLISIKVKTKLVIMPQTIGPFKRGLVKKVAKYILGKANYVFVRDEISKKIAKDDLGIKREIVYVPDMAFYMEPNNSVSIDKFIDRNNGKITIGINVSGLLYNGGYNRDNMFGLKDNYKELVDSIIENLLKDEKNQIILIPHVISNDFQVEDDFRVCKNIVEGVKNKMGKEVYTIDKHYKEDEIKAIISGCDFFIGSRMHACIGAVSCTVPTVPLAYSRKFIGIWNKLSLGYCVRDLKTEKNDFIIQHVDNALAKRNDIKEVLINEIPKLKNEIRERINVIEEK